jgi:phospholipid/cholesterol/gamma-HCH transport system substrate-binding protein
MRQAFIETVVGVFVIIVILCLIFLGLHVSKLGSYQAGGVYQVTADFNNVGDLKPRAPVTIGGVSIGQVSAVQLNPETFQAVVTMEINKKNNNIPTDSTANIFTAGLLGADYISISPGYSNENLTEGGLIQNTNSALILQNLIGQLLFSLKGDKQDKKESHSTPASEKSS